MVPGNEKKICKLFKSLYGLKQVPKYGMKSLPIQWLQQININECDKCVYTKEIENSYIISCLYVNDMLIIGSNRRIFKSSENTLSWRFDMKDVGLADVILRIKITRISEELILN